MDEDMEVNTDHVFETFDSYSLSLYRNYCFASVDEVMTSC